LPAESEEKIHLRGLGMSDAHNSNYTETGGSDASCVMRSSSSAVAVDQHPALVLSRVECRLKQHIIRQIDNPQLPINQSINQSINQISYCIITSGFALTPPSVAQRHRTK